MGRPELTTAPQEKLDRAGSLEWGDPAEAPGGVPVPWKGEGEPRPRVHTVLDNIL